MINSRIAPTILTALLALAITFTLTACGKGGGTFTDSRDGKTYKIVKIGEQTWMAENLNYKPSVGNSRCYEDKEANCDKYGRLYDWETAQTVCPSGWHLSYGEEWDKMFNFADGADTTGNHNGFKAAAKYFKAKSGWSENGTDKFGFSALPGGFYRIDGNQGGMDSSFVAIGELGIWWSGAEINYASGSGYYSHFQFIDKYPSWSGYSDDNLFSVRCVLGDIANNPAAAQSAKKAAENLAQAATPVPAAAESGSGVKLLESMTETDYDGRVETVKFEYDGKDRIVKIHRTYSSGEDTKTLHYDGGKLTKVVCSTDEDCNEDYSTEGDMVRILDDMRPVELTLNKGGYIVNYSGTDGGVTYDYQNGNRVKSISHEANESESTGERIEFAHEYDSKNSPFFNCKTPKWFLQYKYFANANNLIASTQKNYDDNTNSLTAKYETTYVYEYGSDGFPTKQTEARIIDGETYTTTTTFTYIGK